MRDNLLEIPVASFMKREVDLLQYVTEVKEIDLNKILLKYQG